MNTNAFHLPLLLAATLAVLASCSNPASPKPTTQHSIAADETRLEFRLGRTLSLDDLDASRLLTVRLESSEGTLFASDSRTTSVDDFAVTVKGVTSGTWRLRARFFDGDDNLLFYADQKIFITAGKATAVTLKAYEPGTVDTGSIIEGTPVTGILVSDSRYSWVPGEVQRIPMGRSLQLWGETDFYADQRLVWTSENPDVLEVTPQGKLIPKRQSYQPTNIVVTSVQGRETRAYPVVVESPLWDVWKGFDDGQTATRLLRWERDGDGNLWAHWVTAVEGQAPRHWRGKAVDSGIGSGEITFQYSFNFEIGAWETLSPGRSATVLQMGADTLNLEIEDEGTDTLIRHRTYTPAESINLGSDALVYEKDAGELSDGYLEATFANSSVSGRMEWSGNSTPTMSAFVLATDNDGVAYVNSQQWYTTGHGDYEIEDYAGSATIRARLVDNPDAYFDVPVQVWGQTPHFDPSTLSVIGLTSTSIDFAVEGSGQETTYDVYWRLPDETAYVWTTITVPASGTYSFTTQGLITLLPGKDYQFNFVAKGNGVYKDQIFNWGNEIGVHTLTEQGLPTVYSGYLPDWGIKTLTLKGDTFSSQLYQANGAVATMNTSLWMRAGLFTYLVISTPLDDALATTYLVKYNFSTSNGPIDIEELSGEINRVYDLTPVDSTTLQIWGFVTVTAFPTSRVLTWNPTTFEITEAL